MTNRKDLLHSRDSLQSVESYRKALNKLESLADFVYDTLNGVLSYSEKLKKKMEFAGERVFNQKQLRFRNNRFQVCSIW